MSIAVRAGDVAWDLERNDAKSSIRITQLNPPGTRVTALWSSGSTANLAVADGAGSRLLRVTGSSTLLLATTKPIIAISQISPYVLAQLEGGELLTLAYSGDGPMRVVGSSQLAPLDPDLVGGFAGAGYVYAEAESWVTPAYDAPHDGVDRDCNRRD